MHEWKTFDYRETTDNDYITWIFQDFVPVAKLQGDKSYSIISDHIGTPLVAIDNEGVKIWERELDIYGKVRKLQGDKWFIPFLYQGQYYDVETELAYNRFRYYSPDTGAYISQDPIGLEGGLALYSYVFDINIWIDIFGLTGIIYLRTDPFTGKQYVGKSKSPEAFENRKSKHNTQLRKNNNMQGNTGVKYKFEILEQDIVGKDNLAFREETNIRKKGGIQTDGGVLENKIHALKESKYMEMGGDLDKLGKKRQSKCIK
ncbi:RHS repeat domain-containing protein [Capnocytophaga canis]|uniref:RHS repeat domain-containing protein n=1 Tax=Capnocytophaga canis TaxID=1848903 RepID=UPI001561C9CE|nr:RHS repeat-associated core domain-containing protein [Capnocytophaga canis]